jgi:ABC-type Fe3+ transport system permease subunit
VVDERRAAANAQDAYLRGRKDERRRHRGSPLFAFLLLIVVAACAALVVLAIQNGSFQNGGAVVDSSLSHASQSATAPIRKAAAKAGDALETAGQNLKQNAGNEAGD